MIQQGTSYFLNRDTALEYYQSQGYFYNMFDIENKITNKDIHIDQHPTIEGDHLFVNSEGR
jgi:hypothetical protein